MLGILARGTDYVAARPKGHPIQPEPCQIIAKAEEILEKYSCDGIYLATEDQDIYERLQEAFAKECVHCRYADTAAAETRISTTLGDARIRKKAEGNI